MAATWNTIFGIDEPVNAELSEIDAAITEFHNRKITAQAIVNRFSSVGDSSTAGHLEGDVAPVFADVVQDVGGELGALPGICENVVGVFQAHRKRIVDLQAECDDALARAVTLWDKKNDAEGKVSGSESRVRALKSQLDNAGPDEDTSSAESDHHTADVALTNLRNDIGAYERDLAAIGGSRTIGGSGGFGFSCEAQELHSKQRELERTACDELDDIDLGKLKDPKWYEKAIGAIGGFVGGTLESLVNFMEAVITGDLATALWELRNILNSVILVLGTIALFTGIGAPLFFLAVGYLAVTTYLAVTQTPNPQTGETLGVTDVLLATAGVVFSAGGAYRAFKPLAGKTATGMKVFTGAPGGLQSTYQNVKNLGGLANGLRSGNTVAVREAAKGLNMTMPGRHAAGLVRPSNASIVYTTARVGFGVRGTTAKIQNIADAPLGPVGTVTGAKGLDAYGDASGKFSGFDMPNHSDRRGESTPVFGDSPVSQTRTIKELAGRPGRATVVPAH